MKIFISKKQRWRNQRKMNVMVDAKNNEVKKMEENKVENSEVKTMEVKNSEVKKMSNEQTTVTEEQRAEYKKCLNVFRRTAKMWVEVAEAYICLLGLPEELWRSDEVMQGVVGKPTVGKFLKAKFDVSEGRLSQYAGAYKAREELEGVDGYDKISCDALYEIYRFANGKDNAKNMSIKDVYEAVHAEGDVNIKTVKGWRKPFKAKEKNAGKQGESVFERLSKLIDEAEKASLEEATEAMIEALQVKWNAFMDRISKQTDLGCEDDGTEATGENGGGEMTEEKEMARVA